MNNVSLEKESLLLFAKKQKVLVQENDIISDTKVKRTNCNACFLHEDIKNNIVDKSIPVQSVYYSDVQSSNVELDQEIKVLLMKLIKEFNSNYV